MGYKERTRSELLKCYKEYGLETVMEVGRALLEAEKDRNRKKAESIVHGEVCETILECIVMEHKSKHPIETKNWKMARSVILPNLENVQSEFLTELDLVLFTPQQILLFECKSYNGEKTLTGSGKLTRNGGGSVDVYSQNKLHLEMLSKVVAKCRTLTPSYGKEIQMVLFDFSLGGMNDKRSEKAKQILPWYTEETVTECFPRGNSTLWDMRVLAPLVDLMVERSPLLRKQHLQYVKSLHN